MFLLGGIAVFLCSLWFVFALIILFILLECLAVRPEERYLADKLGDDYLDYKASVRCPDGSHGLSDPRGNGTKLSAEKSCTETILSISLSRQIHDIKFLKKCRKGA